MTDIPPPVAPPELYLRYATVRCVWDCPTVVASADRWWAHEAMETHYRDVHADDIAAARAAA